jgi:manganese/zinc/iron transport system permease protein
VGIPVAVLHYLLMGLVAATTVGAFESVGAILVVAMLIVPASTAYLLTHRLESMIKVAILAACISSIGGYQMARALDCSIAGAMASVSGILFLGAFLFSPSQGFLSRLWSQRRMRLRVGEEDILLWAGRRHEHALPGGFTLREVEGVLQKDGRLRSAAQRLRRAGDLSIERGKLALTEKGVHRALALLRRHRLYESYLGELGYPTDHVHAPADRVEHFITKAITHDVEKAAHFPEHDPQGRTIPPEESSG